MLEDIKNKLDEEVLQEINSVIENKQYYIYRITNQINGKICIGQTNNLKQRWAQYRSAAKEEDAASHSMIVHRAMAKYGRDNFVFEAIMTCQDRNAANMLETEAILQYDSTNPDIGYNQDLGGGAADRHPAVVEKIRQSLLKYYETHDGWNKGGTLTEEWKKNISIASMGKAGTNLGRKFDEDWKFELSKSNVVARPSLRKFSPEIEEEICQLYVEKELSTYKLGIQFECARSVVADILQRNNIPTRKSNYTGHSNGCNIFSKEQELEICRVYMESKLTRKGISQQFNCGATTVRDILLRNGVDLKTRKRTK